MLRSTRLLVRLSRLYSLWCNSDVLTSTGNANPIYSKGEQVGKLIHDSVLTSIGEKYGKSGAQVALAWGVKHGRSVIPKSKTEGRIAENLDAVEGQWELTDEDVRRINEEMDKKLRFNDPSERFGWNFYEGLDGK